MNKKDLDKINLPNNLDDVIDEAINMAHEDKKKNKIKGIILDLRRNPGGLLDQAVKISDLFLDKGVIVSNPPYGERLGENVDELYKDFGDTLKQKYAGYSAWFISSNMEALKKVGLKPSKKVKLFNGNLECRLMNYQLYDGSKRVRDEN